MTQAKALGCLAFSVFLLTFSLIATRYVAQQRYATVGFCPIDVSGAPALMVFDSLTAEVFCSPLPQPDRGLIAPTVPNDDKKTGV